MRSVFVQNGNVGRFIGAMNALADSANGGDKMALVTGSAGRGKTHTAIWYASCNDALYLRAEDNWGGNFRIFLRSLIWECGQKPARWTDELVRQAKDILRERRRPLIIDEADYLDRRTINTLRDLHDTVGAPIVMIGMARITRAVLSEQTVWSRITQSVQFHDLARDEIPGILEQLCEVSLSDAAVGEIAENCKMMRDLQRYILEAERKWRGRAQEMPAEAIKSFKARVLQGRKAS